MELLTKTSPAETYLLLEQNQAEFKELLKFTFIDLIRKDVLEPIRITKQANSRDKPRTNTYVQAGPQFSAYQPMKHEVLYLSPFQKSPSIQIHFRHLVAMGIENSDGLYVYRNAILNSSHLKPLIKNGLYGRLFNKVKLTALGKNTKKEVSVYLKKLESEIPKLLKSDEEAALKKLLAIKGNFYLLKNLNFEQLKQIDIQLAKELNRSYRNSDSGCHGFGCWHAYDSYSDSFDSGYDSSGYGGDAGCSGGDGCSGCGGCGGCGGCS